MTLSFASAGQVTLPRTRAPLLTDVINGLRLAGLDFEHLPVEHLPQVCGRAGTCPAAGRRARVCPGWRSSPQRDDCRLVKLRHVVRQELIEDDALFVRAVDVEVDLDAGRLGQADRRFHRSAGIAAGQASNSACETASDLAPPVGSSKRPCSSVRTAGPSRPCVVRGLGRPGLAGRQVQPRRADGEDRGILHRFARMIEHDAADDWARA